MSIALHMLAFTVSVLTLAGGLYFIGIHLYSYADRMIEALQPLDARGIEISRRLPGSIAAGATCSLPCR